MDRRVFISALSGGLLAAPLAAEAQQTEKVYRVGILSAGSQALRETDAVFSQALRELGWIEGKNVVFETRYADDRLDRLPELAAELIRLKVDLIVTYGTLAPSPPSGPRRRFPSS